MLLISACLLSTLSSFANEYLSNTGKVYCTLAGDIQSLDMPKQKLPNVIEFTVSIKEQYIVKDKLLSKDVKKLNLVRREVTSDLGEKVPLSISFAKLNGKYYNYGTKRNVDWRLKNKAIIKYDSLNNEESKELLVQLGASEADVSGLKGKIKPVKVKGGLYDQFGKKSQLHYDVDEKNGLSFHVYSYCKIIN